MVDGGVSGCINQWDFSDAHNPPSRIKSEANEIPNCVCSPYLKHHWKITYLRLGRDANALCWPNAGRILALVQTCRVCWGDAAWKGEYFKEISWHLNDVNVELLNLGKIDSEKRYFINKCMTSLVNNPAQIE